MNKQKLENQKDVNICMKYLDSKNQKILKIGQMLKKDTKWGNICFSDMYILETSIYCPMPCLINTSFRKLTYP